MKGNYTGRSPMTKIYSWNNIGIPARDLTKQVIKSLE